MTTAAPLADRASYERVLRALDSAGTPARRVGSTMKALCPAHPDRNPSLGINWKAGATLLRCYAGCQTTDIVAALGLSMSDLFDQPPAGKIGRRSQTAWGAGKSTGRGKPSKTSPAPQASPATAKPVDDLGARIGPWTVVTVYDYEDENGEILGQVVRREAEHERGRDKRFGQRCPDPKHPDRWLRRQPERKVLYRLPGVLQAIGRGEPVYVAEGEKDADALIEAGVMATTNAGGASTWRAEYGEQLAGGHVVVVVDRDEAGYRRGERLRADLHQVAASVTVVEPVVGKDAHDHLTAGHSVGALRAVAAPAPDLDEAPAGPSGVIPLPPRRKSGGDDWDNVPNTQPVYRFRDHAIVRVDRRPSGEPKFTVMLGCEARIVRQEVADDGNPDTPTTTAGYDLHLRHAVTKPDEDGVDRRTGDVEDSTMYVTLEQIRDGSWLANMPWSGVYYGDQRRLREEAWTAVRMASGGGKNVTVYTAPGWRTRPNGSRFFVHAGGAIGPDGTEDVGVRLPDPFHRLHLPDPTDDPALIRAAARHSVGLLDVLPARILAPVLGQTYRAPLGRTPSTVTLMGERGSGKSGTVALSAQHFYPGFNHDRKLLSGTGLGGSAKGATKVLALARDSLLILDDAPPEKGKLRSAAGRLGDIVREQFDGEGAYKSSRDGRLIHDPAPTGSLLATSEVSTGVASAEERMFTVLVEKADLHGDPAGVLGALDTPEALDGRPAFMAAYLRWLANPDTYARAEQARSHHTKTCPVKTAGRECKPDCDRYIDVWARAGFADSRTRTALAHLAVGWRLVCDFLADTGAYSPAEAGDLFSRAWDGLADAGTDQAIAREAVDPVAQMLSYLRSGLLSGEVHTPDHISGAAPDWPLAAQLGWARDLRAQRDTANLLSVPLIPRGKTIGWINQAAGRLYLLPDEVFRLATRAAAAADETFAVAKRVLSQALDDAGLIDVTIEAGRRRRDAKKPAPGGRPRVWDFDLAAFLDHGDDPDPAGPILLSPEPPPAAPEPPPAALEPPAAGDDQAAAVVVDQVVDGDEEYLDECRTCEVCAEPTRWLIQGIPLHLDGGCKPPPAAPPAAAALASDPAVVVVDELDEIPGQTALDGVDVPLPDEPPVDEPGPDPRPAPAPSRPLPTFEGRWRAPAAVLDVAGVFLPDGSTVPLPARPIAHAGDLAAIAAALNLGHGGDRKRLPAAGQLWITAAMAAQLGLPRLPATPADDAGKDRKVLQRKTDPQFLGGAVAAGWTVGNRNDDGEGQVGPYMRMWRTTAGGGSQSVMLVICPWTPLYDDTIAEHLLGGDPSAGELAQRVSLYTTQVGVPYRTTAAATGLDLLGNARPRNGRARRVTEAVDPPAPLVKRVPLAQTPSWTRKLTPAERKLRYLHAVDVNGQFLAAAGGATLGLGAAEHHHGDLVTFDAKKAGLWLIPTPEADLWGIFDLSDPGGMHRRSRSNRRWVTTPVLTELRKADETISPIEAWVWPDGTRYLEPWYQTIRDARRSLTGPAGEDSNARAVLAAVNATYKATIGRFGAERFKGSPLYRPDWRAMIIGAAVTNMYRTLTAAGHQTGQWPIAASADSVLYVSADPDPAGGVPAALSLDDRLGKFKVAGSGLLINSIEALDRGEFCFTTLTLDAIVDGDQP